MNEIDKGHCTRGIADRMFVVFRQDAMPRYAKEFYKSKQPTETTAGDATQPLTLNTILKPGDGKLISEIYLPIFAICLQKKFAVFICYVHTTTNRW